MDANDDDIIDESVYEEIEIDPATGLTEDGLTREQAVAALLDGAAGELDDAELDRMAAMIRQTRASAGKDAR